MSAGRSQASRTGVFSFKCMRERQYIAIYDDRTTALQEEILRLRIIYASTPDSRPQTRGHCIATSLRGSEIETNQVDFDLPAHRTP